jgi:chromosome segregation ATPase
MSRDNDKDDEVRYNVKMRRQLREDAKRKAERGELADDVRNLFRRKAYGEQAAGETTELERTKAELRDVRDRIDDLRRERSQIDSEIQAQETRATRLEERVEALEEQQNDLEQTVETLENLLQSGERMWPTKVKNAADVDKDTAVQLHEQLKDRNADLPTEAFEQSSVHEPFDWMEATQQ